MKIRYAGSTHVGMKRAHNEDNFRLLGEENLYVVADGMGGHASGEVASEIAVEAVASFYADTGQDQEITWPYREDRALAFDENRLITAIRLANLRVYEKAQSDARYRGMGTTIVALACGPSGAFVAHVGDSRGYMLRDGAISQVTEDHSLLNDYLKVHKLSPAEIEHFPHKNVIVRALGMGDSVKVETTRIQPRPGDVYLLCSDGLSGMLPDPTMLELVRGCAGNLERSCQQLIEQANAHGGQDNITVVMVEFT